MNYSGENMNYTLGKEDEPLVGAECHRKLDSGFKTKSSMCGWIL